MNVLELIKSLGPKADANKIILAVRHDDGKTEYASTDSPVVIWTADIDLAWIRPIKNTQEFLERLAPLADQSSATYSVQTLAECGYNIHWDSTFAENGDIRVQPELLENPEFTCDYKGMIAAAKQALKEYLGEAKEAVKSAENKVKAENRDLISAEKYVAAGFKSIAAVTSAKPRPKKKPVAIKIRKFSVAGKGDQPQKLPKKTKKKEKKKLLRAVKAASRKKKRK